MDAHIFGRIFYNKNIYVSYTKNIADKKSI